MAINNDYTSIPSSGRYKLGDPDYKEPKHWPSNHVLPQGISGSLSTGGWTADSELNTGNEGFIQQTFLGASIRSFNINAGFGDSTSSLSVQLVNDEFNLSDATTAGEGDDPYHSGNWKGFDSDNRPIGGDTFRPPIVGTPVFFKFGKNPATIEQAYRKTFDDITRLKSIPDPPKYDNGRGGFLEFPNWHFDHRVDDFNQLEPYHFVDIVNKRKINKTRLWQPRDEQEERLRGRDHFVFGGILQSYTENQSSAGNPLYSVNINDPREILSNAILIFNNYQGTTFNNKNLFNIYGFLEYDPSDDLRRLLDEKSLTGLNGKGIVRKNVNPLTGEVTYAGFEDPDFIEKNGGENVPPPTVTIQPTFGDFDDPTDDRFLPFQVNLLDQYYFENKNQNKFAFDQNMTSIPATLPSCMPEFFPITGQGFSRRSDKGIPFYRVSQAIASLFQQNGFLPQEYLEAGFGGTINFRGYNYVIDFGGIPIERIPLMYYMDFDQIDMLSFVQELCDIISHELFVTLLPVIDHPSCNFLYQYNNEMVRQETPENIVAGIIRIDAIDKTMPPRYGAIKSYLDELEKRRISVENQDIGFELSNVTTDKFVVGGQKVDMHYFTTNKDRDDLEARKNEKQLTNKLEVKQQEQWTIEHSLKQQVLPFYGFLGKKAVTIPKGMGSYQQILLDTSSLDAFGVGNYYVATEMELRAALVSFKRWKEFLLSYNETYIQDVSQYNATYASLANGNDSVVKALDDWKSVLGVDAGDPLESGILAGLGEREWAVSVPRCVWNSDKPYMGKDGYPASPCSPPYGYPLYYKRAQKIGIPEAGVVEIQNAVTKAVSNYETLNNATSDGGNFFTMPSDDLVERIEFYERRLAAKRINWDSANPDDIGGYASTTNYIQLKKALDEAKAFYKSYRKRTAEIQTKAKDRLAKTRNMLTNKDGPIAPLIANLPRTAKSHLENAQKVYNFVKKVAEDNLGKKFLVKIPKVCNYRYQTQIITTLDNTDNVVAGPFGFAPTPINADPRFSFDVNSAANVPIDPVTGEPAFKNSPATQAWLDQMQKRSLLIQNDDLYEHYLNYAVHVGANIGDGQRELGLPTKPLPGIGWHPANNGVTSQIGKDPYTMGALKCNWNPFEEAWEYNYKPEPQGGFFGYDLFPKNINSETGMPFDKLPVGVQQGLIPLDMTNLVEDGNRVKCYVRYDHSELLDFTNVNADSMTQQTIDAANGVVPDVVQTLPNMRPDKKVAFDTIAERHKDNKLLDRQKPSVAFVKCEVDEEFYMPPKLHKNPALPIFGQKYDLQLSEPPFDIVESVDDDGCPAFKFEVRRITPIFSLGPSGGLDLDSAFPTANQVDFIRGQVASTKNDLLPENTLDEGYSFGRVDTRLQNLDSDHVYALITVPGRIQSTVDQRWADGPMQAFNTVRIKNVLTADVVKIPDFFLPGFAEPKDRQIICQTKEERFPGGFDSAFAASEHGKAFGLIGSHSEGEGLSKVWYPGRPEDYVDLTLTEINEAQEAQKLALKGITLSDPEGGLSFIQPSPIYPNLVALPLMSWEKCYGPWLSSSQLDPSADARIKFSNIGGKVEFVKDENLAPWNFAGYQLMNEAGKLQADFSNSLLLFSERGGFVIPDAPTGIAIATALQLEGPLITSISVDVGQQGVKTTVKMDLYTSQYGKLQKQKEGAIAQIARERQKLKDASNNAARRGFGKSSTNKNLMGGLLANGGQKIIDLAKGNETFINNAMKEGSPGQVIVLDELGGAIQTQEAVDQFMGMFPESAVQQAQEYGNKFIGTIGQFLMGGSNDVQNDNLPNAEYSNPAALQDSYNPPNPNAPTDL